jgi:DNA polymerase
MLQVLRPLTTNANDDGTGTSHVLFRDIETRSTLDLKQVGAHRCATHKTTEVLCIGFAVDDEPAELWTPGNPVPAVFIEAARNRSWVVAAHHDAFESAIEHHILAPLLDWPLVPIRRHRCTQAMALALALPASLDGAAAALGLPGKDLAEHRRMLAMSKPRKPRGHEDPALGPYWVEDLDRRQRLHAYCKQDVELLRLLYRKLRPLVPSEQELWELDSIVNARGIAVDLPLVSAALSVEQAIAANLNTRLAKLTDGAVERVTQGERLKAWLEQQGCTLKSLTKDNVAASLVADDSISLPVREALEIRQAGAKASTRKLPKLLACCGADARARGLMQFHRASTGRWSGQRLQPQNLPRPVTKHVDAAIATLRTGDAKAFSAQHPFPLSTLSDCIRGMLIAPPGHRLIAGDYNAIERRVLAYIAGEHRKIAAHAAFDARTGQEPYLIIAADIHGVLSSKDKIVKDR